MNKQAYEHIMGLLIKKAADVYGGLKPTAFEDMPIYDMMNLSPQGRSKVVDTLNNGVGIPEIQPLSYYQENANWEDVDPTTLDPFGQTAYNSMTNPAAFQISQESYDSLAPQQQAMIDASRMGQFGMYRMGDNGKFQRIKNWNTLLPETYSKPMLETQQYVNDQAGENPDMGKNMDAIRRARITDAMKADPNDRTYGYNPGQVDTQRIQGVQGGQQLLGTLQKYNVINNQIAEGGNSSEDMGNFIKRGPTQQQIQTAQTQVQQGVPQQYVVPGFTGKQQTAIIDNRVAQNVKADSQVASQNKQAPLTVYGNGYTTQGTNKPNAVKPNENTASGKFIVDRRQQRLPQQFSDSAKNMPLDYDAPSWHNNEQEARNMIQSGQKGRYINEDVAAYNKALMEKRYGASPNKSQAANKDVAKKK